MSRHAIWALLVLLLACRPGWAVEGPVKEIRVEGNRRTPLATILAELETKVGGPFVEGDSERIFKLGWFTRVAPRLEAVEGGVRLVFAVVENPVIDEIALKGVSRASEADLRGLMTSKPGDILNTVRVEADTRAINNHYNEVLGYFLNNHIDDLAIGDGRLVITITEAAKVRSVVVTGAREFSGEELISHVTTRSGDDFNVTTVKSDASALGKLYEEHDLILDNIKPLFDPDSGALTFHIVEARLESLKPISSGDFSGMVSDAAVVKRWPIPPGGILKRRAIQDALQAFRVIGPQDVDLAYLDPECLPDIEPKPGAEEGAVIHELSYKEQPVPFLRQIQQFSSVPARMNEYLKAALEVYLRHPKPLQEVKTTLFKWAIQGRVFAGDSAAAEGLLKNAHKYGVSSEVARETLRAAVRDFKGATGDRRALIAGLEAALFQTKTGTAEHYYVSALLAEQREKPSLSLAFVAQARKAATKLSVRADAALTMAEAKARLALGELGPYRDRVRHYRDLEHENAWDFRPNLDDLVGLWVLEARAALMLRDYAGAHDILRQLQKQLEVRGLRTGQPTIGYYLVLSSYAQNQLEQVAKEYAILEQVAKPSHPGNSAPLAQALLLRDMSLFRLDKLTAPELRKRIASTSRLLDSTRSSVVLLAEAHLQVGDYERSAEICRNLLQQKGLVGFERLNALCLLAEGARRQARHGEARRWLTEARDVEQQWQARVIPLLSSGQLVSFQKSRPVVNCALAIGDPKLVRQCLNAPTGTRESRALATPDRKVLRQLRRRLSEITLDAAAERSAGTEHWVRSMLCYCRYELDGKEQKLLRARPTAAVQKVPAGIVVVQYLQFPGVKASTEFGCLVLTADASVWVPLGSIAAYTPLIERFRRVLDPSVQVRATDPDVQRLPYQLAKLVWDPVEARFPKDTKTVLVCPDGALNFLPFGFLPDQSGRLVLEKYDVAYYDSLNDLFLPSANESTAGVPSLLCLANPKFAGKDSSEPVHQLSALRDSTLEYCVRLKSKAQTHGWSVRGPYPADEASEERLFAELDSGAPDILLLATHGFFLPRKGDSDSLNTFGPPLNSGVFIDPMLRSGVALAEANPAYHRFMTPGQSNATKRDVPELNPLFAYSDPSVIGKYFAMLFRAEGGRESNDLFVKDGIVMGAELQDLNLSRTRLVAVSACQSGFGEPVDGMGVWGLRRALSLSGAQSTMLTLWPVDEVKAGEFTEGLIASVLEGTSPFRALNDVQRGMISSLRQARLPEWEVARHAGAYFLQVSNLAHAR